METLEVEEKEAELKPFFPNLGGISAVAGKLGENFTWDTFQSDIVKASEFAAKQYRQLEAKAKTKF